MWANLIRSLRRARSVSLPSDHDAAIKMLLPMVFANMHRSLAELLENSNFDINHKFGTVKRTLLHIAANTGYPESLVVLLKKEADPNIQDIAGHTALHIAARNGFKSCVEKLLEYGGDPNICGNDGANVLHWASVNGRIEVLNTVLKQITNVNSEDSQGNTALHSSARNGHVKVMKALINAGANVNQLNNLQQNPLHTACSTGQRNSVSFLLTLNPSIKPDAENFTPLTLCLRGGYGVAATLLLEKFSKEPSYEAMVSTFVECAIYRSDLKTKKITRCLTTIESERIVNLIFEKLCKVSCDLGLQVQSITSDLENLKTFLFKSIEIIKQFLKPKQDRLDSSGNGVFIPSKKFLNIFLALWESVNDWFLFFHSNTSNNTTKSTDVQIANHEILVVMIERLSILVSVLYTISDLSDDSRTFSFSDFIFRHIQILKIIVKDKSEIIFNYFSFLLDNHLLMEPFLPTIKSQPLDKRYKWFYDHLKEVKERGDKILSLQINRTDIFRDSCKKIEKLNPQILLSGINIQFQDEEGMGEGVTREWFNVLLPEIVNPEYGLFSQSADGCTFQPSSQSAVNPDHIAYFRFAGRILGLAMFNRHLVDVRFTRSFYKHLLGIKVNYDDVASIDSEYAKNLQWILDNDISELGLGLTFLVETDVFGKMQEIELKPNGSQLSVTEVC